MRALCSTADAVCHSMNRHMAHEEADVLPLLEKHLCAAEQRAMVWRTLRGMPLRLLERVMPWVAGTRLPYIAGLRLGGMLCCQLAASSVT